MKKLLFTLIVAGFGIAETQAQNNAISTYFADMLDRQDITTIQLSGKAFELSQHLEADSEETKKALKLASQVTGFHAVVDDADADARIHAVEARKKVISQFEDLITISEKDALVNVMVQENNGIVSEVFVIVGADSAFALLSLSGQMRLSDVGDLTSLAAKVGTDVYAKTGVDGAEVKLYPNPVREGALLNIDLPETLQGANVRIIDANGKQVGAFQANGKTKRYDTSKIPKGMYVMEIQKGDMQVSKKFFIN